MLFFCQGCSDLTFFALVLSCKMIPEQPINFNHHIPVVYSSSRTARGGLGGLLFSQRLVEGIQGCLWIPTIMYLGMQWPGGGSEMEKETEPRKEETDLELPGATLEDNWDNCPLSIRKQSQKSLLLEWTIKQWCDDQLPRGLPAQDQNRVELYKLVQTSNEKQKDTRLWV